LQSWIDIADQYRFEIRGSSPLGESVDRSDAQSYEMIAGEIEGSIREFIKEGKEHGNIRSGLSDEAIMAYVSFFQQGVASNPGIHERILRDAGFSKDMLSLFIYGVAGRSG